MPRMNDAPVTSEAGYRAHPYGIRPHKPMTLEESEQRRQILEATEQVEWVTVAEPGETDQVPYSYTCDAGNCDNETVMIVKTVERPLPNWRNGGTTTFWLSVCRQHFKDEMDYASLMRGRLYVVVVRPDLAGTEITEDL